MPLDVPSPIDLRTMKDALVWEASALEKRPWRTEFFAEFIAAIGRAPGAIHNVLELGSGPGFLAAEVLPAFPQIRYSALDFSPAMHQLARARVAPWRERAEFIERNFRDAAWSTELDEFDCVVTNQAVHELRHKAHALGFHRQVRSLLRRNGVYLVCDHFAGAGGMRDERLYMTVEEQRIALLAAGFTSVTSLMEKGGLVLHQAT